MSRGSAVWLVFVTALAGAPGAASAEFDSYRFTATATGEHSRIYQWVGRRPKLAGKAIAGAMFSVEKVGPGRKCRGGIWYRTFDGAFICSKRGFRVTQQRSEKTYVPPMAVRYAWLAPKTAIYLRRGELASTERASRSARRRSVKGVRFIASRESAAETGDFVSTTRGAYVARQSARWLSPSRLKGVVLNDANALPMAMTYQRQKHHRIRIKRIDRARKQVFALDGTKYGFDHVRVFKRRRRPRKIPAGAKWIHIDRGQQTLVAYEGNKPVFATLVSTGKRRHGTPLGIWRIYIKLRSQHLTGVDRRTQDPYVFDDVPWIMYYDGNYGLHGAYWHNAFGKPHSHGCVNLSIADAKWLFGWATPGLPSGWRVRYGLGPWVYVTY